MIRDIVHTAYQTLLDVIAPPFCPSCLVFLTEHTLLCSSCWLTVKPVAPLLIEITRTKRVPVHVVGAYEGALKKLILKKNNRTRAIVISSLLGQCLWEQSALKNLSFDYIVPIPLHWTRKAWRGFNQAEEIANVIAQHSGKKVIHALARSRKTRFQAECSKEARVENIQGALTLNIDPTMICGKTILLVDDLVTTGTTIKAACALLYSAKVERIIIGAVARTT
jgi:ComF family protein